MTYVDGFHDHASDKIKLVERNAGNRVYRDLPVPYTFYYRDQRGQHTSLFGDALTKYTTSNGADFKKERANHHGPLFESDCNLVFRCLSENYRNCETPILNVGFFDIEVAFDSKRGYAPTTDPFNAVTAVSVYLQWAQTCITLVLCPPTLTMLEATAVASQFDNTILFDNEAKMLLSFLDVIEDCDVLSGWNSTGYDIPYLVNRIALIINKDTTRRFCLWNQPPRIREYEKFKKKHKTYDLVGRVHLDYLDLYQKHNTQQLHSYTLDFVGEHEVGERKTPYEGTLDDLYKKDFRKFIEYNRQDVLLLTKIDEKCKFIELSNQVAHANTVLLKTTLGSVALIEQSIINEMHDKGVIAPDRKADIIETDVDDEEEEDEHNPVVGAYVAHPKVGLHEEIGAVDINSLYPSAIRALNMSPETLFAQIQPDETSKYIATKVAGLPEHKRADAWEGIFATLEYDHVMQRDDYVLTIGFANGSTNQLTGKELYDIVFAPDSHLCITANGTIFRTDVAGIIPGLLAQWYFDRQSKQARSKTWAMLAEGMAIEDATLRQLLEATIVE